ncbi:protein of unknown function [Streptomyces sp. KY70]|nr:protein of unknown function [Streptomyces sp. KY70]
MRCGPTSPTASPGASARPCGWPRTLRPPSSAAPDRSSAPCSATGRPPPPCPAEPGDPAPGAAPGNAPTVRPGAVRLSTGAPDPKRAGRAGARRSHPGRRRPAGAALPAGALNSLASTVAYTPRAPAPAPQTDRTAHPGGPHHDLRRTRTAPSPAGPGAGGRNARDQRA